LLVVALLGLSACSDAHSQAQLDLQNHGYDPTAVVILAPAVLAPTLKELGFFYTRDHPGASFVLVSDVEAGMASLHRGRYQPKAPANGKASLEAQPAPELWIDISAAQRALLPPDVHVVGAPEFFGYDRPALVVQPGNPDHVTGLTVFAKGSGLRTGMCVVHTTCGSLGRIALQHAHVKPAPRVTATSGTVLLGSVIRGHLAAALTTSIEAANAFPRVTTVPLTTPPHGYATYTMVRLDASLLGQQFVDWITNSPIAVRILAAHGITRTTGAPS
jgi:hypothetical protein